MQTSRKLLWLILIAVIIVVALMIGTNFYFDLLWFKELAYEKVFWTQLLTRWGLRLAAWVFLFVFLFVNLMLTRRQVLLFPNLQLREQMSSTGFIQFLTSRRVTIFYLAAALVLSFLFSAYAGGYWMDLLRFLNYTSFDVGDPLFGIDVSFYIFQLPFLRFIYSFLMIALVLSLVLTGIIYLIISPQLPQRRFLTAAFPGLSHVSVLLAAILGLKAWDYHLQQLELVLSSRGKVFGAGYTDVNANLPVLKLLMVLAGVIAVVFLANAFLRRPRLLLYGGLVILGVSVIGGTIFPNLMQNLRVEPSEFAFEREYLEHNIEFTRRAYGLDRISTRSYAASDTLTWEDLKENPGTINNVRLWDYRPLLSTLNQLQVIRLYYRFHDVDVDRYTVDSDYRQVMLAARELEKENLDERARTWINLHLQYTHGYGLTMSPVNEVTSEGLPRFFVRDIPAVTAGGLEIKQPAIYYGETTGDYVIVNTRTPEFHYATAGDENVFVHYEGEGGIELNSLWRRLLFALRFGEYRILISGEITGESRIMFNRQIPDRIKKIAPFLRYDGDPYMVLSEGRLFWIQDAYTVSSSYPYSTPFGDINYIRNSVKVVVDAYNGNVDFYLVEPGDPVAQTFSRIFPGLFKPFEEMPADLQQHLRYPEDIFTVQARMLLLYHSTDPNVVYSREDLWDIPAEVFEGAETTMEPYYTVLQLPGYDREEFVLILPFTPSHRDNMIAWMVARCDQPQYGQVELFLFPKDRVILGPKQIENRIDQNTEISEQLTLWNQSGSRVIRGNLLVLPLNNALLYVEPIFLRAEEGGLPELARVLVVFQEKVVMERTLEEALVRIFGEMEEPPADPGVPEQPSDPGGAEDPAAEPDPLKPVNPIEDAELKALLTRLQEVYEEALSRQRQGDWAGYGEKLSELERIMQQLERYIQ